MVVHKAIEGLRRLAAAGGFVQQCQQRQCDEPNDALGVAKFFLFPHIPYSIIW